MQEAQVFGKPILATDCSGNREQIENGTDGILCGLDSGQVCEKLLYMINNPEKCKGYAEKAKQKELCNTKGFDEFIAMTK